MSPVLLHTTRVKQQRREQPWPIRIMHWANLPLVVIMAGSGLQILVAYPFLGPVGASFDWYPLQGADVPSAFRLGGWLAGARALHFGFGWFFTANGVAYLVYLLVSGEWRRRVFRPRRDARGAARAALDYLRLREPRAAELYNPLQRLAYTSAVALAVILVLSGLAIWKPLQLAWLATLFGGYDGARAVHLLGLFAIALFSIAHVLMVLLHPRALVAMLSGGRKSNAAQAHRAS